MDVSNVKKFKNALLTMSTDFSVITDENFNFIHSPSSGNIVIFDDDNECIIGIKSEDYLTRSISIVEYSRILFFRLHCSKDNNKTLKFIDSIDSDFISQKSKDEIKRIINK